MMEFSFGPSSLVYTKHSFTCPFLGFRVSDWELVAKVAPRKACSVAGCFSFIYLVLNLQV